MRRTIKFFPARKTGIDLLMLALFFLAGAAMFGWFALTATGNQEGGLWLGFFGCVELAFGLATLRASRHHLRARASDDPIIQLTPESLVVRDSFFWRKHEFAWGQISALAVVMEDKRPALWAAGDLKPFGRRFTVQLDDPRDIAAINQELRSTGYLTPRPLLHPDDQSRGSTA